jgi:hypothetical protein
MGYQLWRDAMLQNSVSKIVIHQSLPSNLLDDFKGDFNFGAIVPMPVEVQILAEHENNLFNPIKENQPEYIKALSVVQDKFQISSARNGVKSFGIHVLIASMRLSWTIKSSSKPVDQFLSIYCNHGSKLTKFHVTLPTFKMILSIGVFQATKMAFWLNMKIPLMKFY